MIVSPCSVDISRGPDGLYELLETYKPALVKEKKQVLSISIKIPPTDPLLSLSKSYESDSLHFFCETEDRAIVAIDSVLKVQAKGRDRFLLSQKFVDSCMFDAIIVGELNNFFSGPRFFCSFTFFDENTRKNCFHEATVFLPRWSIGKSNNTYVLGTLNQ